MCPFACFTPNTSIHVCTILFIFVGPTLLFGYCIHEAYTGRTAFALKLISRSLPNSFSFWVCLLFNDHIAVSFCVRVCTTTICLDLPVLKFLVMVQLVLIVITVQVHNLHTNKFISYSTNYMYSRNNTIVRYVRYLFIFQILNLIDQKIDATTISVWVKVFEKATDRIMQLTGYNCRSVSKEKIDCFVTVLD